MKLVNSEYNICLEFEENQTMVMVIEEKKLRLKLVEDIYRQCMGEEGDFVLSDRTNILKMNKTADILLNPFSLDYNNKKVLTKLYQKIQECGNEDFYVEKEKINSDILLLLDKIMFNVPYNITTNLNFDLVDMCKIYNVQLENTGNTFLERLMEYIKVMSQLCSCKLFILLNFSMYLRKDEVKALIEFVSYQKIYLLLLEYAMPLVITGEKGCIIDEDGCIINIEKGNLQRLPGVEFGENQNGFEV